MYRHRNLNAQPAIRATNTMSRVPAWLDIENLLTRPPTSGAAVSARAVAQAVLAAAAKVASVGQVYAFGDFRLLARRYGCNVQSELRQLQMRTFHLDNKRGKNTADMAIACHIVKSIYSRQGLHSILIGTGDRDFCPVVETAQQCGIQVVVLSFANSISRDLAAAADRIIYLEPHLPA